MYMYLKTSFEHYAIQIQYILKSLLVNGKALFRRMLISLNAHISTFMYKTGNLLNRLDAVTAVTWNWKRVMMGHLKFRNKSLPLPSAHQKNPTQKPSSAVDVECIYMFLSVGYFNGWCAVYGGDKDNEWLLALDDNEIDTMF